MIRELNYVRITLGLCLMLCMWIGYRTHQDANRLDAIEQLVQEVEGSAESSPSMSDVNEAYRRCTAIDQRVNDLTTRYEDHLTSDRQAVIVLNEGPAGPFAKDPTPTPSPSGWVRLNCFDSDTVHYGLISQ